MDKFWRNAQVYGRRSKKWKPRNSYVPNKKNYELIPMGEVFNGDIAKVCSQIMALIKHKKDATVEVVLSNYNRFYERQEHLVKITVPRERNRIIFYEFHYINGKWLHKKVVND